MKEGEQSRIASDCGYRRRTAASRARMLRSAPGPVPFGGLRIPSSRSFSTTALLCVSILRGIEECQTFSFVGQGVQLLQIFFGFRTAQFFQVALAERAPRAPAGRDTTCAGRRRERDRAATRAGRRQFFAGRAATGGRRERSLRRSATPIRTPASRQLAWLWKFPLSL